MIAQGSVCGDQPASDHRDTGTSGSGTVRRGPRPLALAPFLLLVGVVLAGELIPLAGQTPSAFGIIVEGKLTVGLSGRTPQVLERSHLATLPHTTIKVKDARGKSVAYTGVDMHDVLETVGWRFSDRRNLGGYVMVEPVAGRHVLFALAELDPALTQKHVILADGKDGKPIPSPEGPFRIIVPDEKEPARWVQQVWALYVVPDS